MGSQTTFESRGQSLSDYIARMLTLDTHRIKMSNCFAHSLPCSANGLHTRSNNLSEKWAGVSSSSRKKWTESVYSYIVEVMNIFIVPGKVRGIHHAGFIELNFI